MGTESSFVATSSYSQPSNPCLLRLIHRWAHGKLPAFAAKQAAPRKSITDLAPPRSFRSIRLLPLSNLPFV